MQNLDRRISALELATTPTDTFTIIMRRMVTLGHLDAEIDHIHDAHGNEWARQTGETEAAFIDRAASETPTKARGIKALIGSTLEHSHEND